ncbi:MAG: hypothetical protein WCW33_01540 [Candidatus Babeliales bacterium]
MNLFKKFLVTLVAGLSMSSMYAMQQDDADYGNEYGVDALAASPAALPSSSVSSSSSTQSSSQKSNGTVKAIFDYKKLQSIAAQTQNVTQTMTSAGAIVEQFTQDHPRITASVLLASLVALSPVFTAAIVSIATAILGKKHSGKVFTGAALGVLALVLRKHYGYLGFVDGKLETTLMLSFLFIATYCGYRYKTGR